MKKDLKGREYLQKGTAIFRVGDSIIVNFGNWELWTTIERLYPDNTVMVADGRVVSIDNIEHNPHTIEMLLGRF